MVNAQFELKPVKDALIPLYPGMVYDPPEEDTEPLRLRRAPACISLLCIFLLSFGLMLSAVSCNKDDDGSGDADGDIENSDSDAVPCNSADNACVDNETARICIEGKLEEVNCQKYCEEYFEEGYGYYSNGCNINDAENVCSCYTQTAGDGDFYSDETVCISDEMLNNCQSGTCEEISCTEFCQEDGKKSNGCITLEEGMPYCDCTDCTSDDNVCIDDESAMVCIDGKLEEVNCDEYCQATISDEGGGVGSEGCNEGAADYICGCYTTTLGEVSDCQPESSYCIDGENLNDCSEHYWREINCAEFCQENGKVSDGCVAPEEGAPYCDCVDCSSEDNECIDMYTASVCIEGTKEVIDCSDYCNQCYPGLSTGGCSAIYTDDICDCWSSSLGGAIEAPPEPGSCASEDILLECPGYKINEVNCTEFCQQQGRISEGCIDNGDYSAAHCLCIDPDGDIDSEAGGDADSDGEEDPDVTE